MPPFLARAKHILRHSALDLFPEILASDGSGPSSSPMSRINVPPIFSSANLSHAAWPPRMLTDLHPSTRSLHHSLTWYQLLPRRNISQQASQIALSKYSS